MQKIPDWDYRTGGLAAFAADRHSEASAVMDAVLDGLGLAGTALRPFLPLGDRIAARHLARIDDPYRDEILALPRLMGRPGAIAFSLSYEWGCTSRAFGEGGMPTLFRVLDWPFAGLGQRIEVVRLSGPGGDWITATWPGVVGVLHGAAPGRFAIALNQAPERRTGLGRLVDWVSSKRRFLRQRGLPPAHLLRQVFEEAPDYPAARAMLTQAPVAAPVIFTLAGTDAEQTCTIERIEDRAIETAAPTATNHFTSALGDGAWRPRGEDSAGRHQAALALDAPPPIDGLTPPILNSLTRLALVMDAGGALSVAGYEGEKVVSGPGRFQV
ncbi:MAG: hypothetical protein OEN23_09225 [Paracoccaceae bacterium]|nr:hypothetical protein [Paracoccaceae bacterium]